MIYDLPSGKRYCDTHSHTFISSGNCPKCKSVSPKQKDEQLRPINEQLRGVSITRKYVRRSLTSVYERFHNFGVRFDAVVDWDALFKFEDFSFGRTIFKRLDFPLAIVKVFRRSILVTLRASQEVKGLDVREAERVSRLKVNEVLSLLPKSIIVSNPDTVNVHNAFVNHPTAKYNVSVSVDGEKRLISDNSKGLAEFEAVNPKFVVSDSEILERFNKDLIVNNPELLSEQQSKLKFVVDVMNEYAVNMKRHISVMENIDKGICVLNSSLKKDLQGEFSESPTNSSFVSLPAISKFDIDNRTKTYRLFRARQLLKEYGWGEQVW